jgi:hypothetical protein
VTHGVTGSPRDQSDFCEGYSRPLDNGSPFSLRSQQLINMITEEPS